MTLLSRALPLLLALSLMGCMSAYKKKVGAESAEQVFTKIYLADFNTTWQAALEALKSYPLDISNRESGFIRTKWRDNTAKKNFIDTFGEGKTYLKAQYRFTVNVAEGFFDGRPSVKVTVQKEQLVQSDVLEGWRALPSDTYDENTYLYRVARLVVIRKKLETLEDEKTRRAVEAAEVTTGGE